VRGELFLLVFAQLQKKKISETETASYKRKDCSNSKREGEIGASLSSWRKERSVARKTTL